MSSYLHGRSSGTETAIVFSGTCQKILWRLCRERGHDGRVTRPQDRPRSGPLSADALSWLVRQACGEKVESCRRKQDSHAREVHEVVTASGGRLVDRAALGAGYGPAAFWHDQGRRLALGQLRLLIGFAAYDLRTGNPAEARDLADLRVLLAGKLRNSVFPELPQVTCGLIVDELCKSPWITIVMCG